MSTARQLLNPELISRIARLEIRARHVVEGFLSGMHRSSYFGHSVEFLQHREYAWGDDIRDVDWKVWAKQDRFYVKQYEEDTNLRATLLVDVSASMSYGSGPLSKFDCAATIAASLAYLILRQRDAVGCVTFDSNVRAVVPQRTKRNHIDAIVQALNASRPEEKTDLGEILRRAAATSPRRGLMILVSDLLAGREGLFQGLRLLRSRGHDVMVLHVMDDDELEFPFSGSTRFDALESDQRLRCNPRALRDGYLAALGAFLEEVRRGCASHDVSYTLLRTRQSLAAALAAYLSKRMGMRRKK